MMSVFKPGQRLDLWISCRDHRRFRAVSRGFARSRRGVGRHWRWSPLGPDGGLVTSLAIDPADAGTIYAGTQLGYVFKSTSASPNWAAASPMLAYLQVGALAIDPANPTTLYAGTESGLFKTVDGAGTWSLIITGNDASAVAALMVDPVHTTTLFAATARGLTKSTDGGTSWSTVDATTSVHVLAMASPLWRSRAGGTGRAAPWRRTPRSSRPGLPRQQPQAG